jgi:hypothetical protein
VLSDSSLEDKKGLNDELLTMEQIQKMVGSTEKPNLRPEERLWLNRDISHVDSDLAVDAVLVEAIFERIKVNVTKLIVGSRDLRGSSSR